MEHSNDVVLLVIHWRRHNCADSRVTYYEINPGMESELYYDIITRSHDLSHNRLEIDCTLIAANVTNALIYLISSIKL